VKRRGFRVRAERTRGRCEFLREILRGAKSVKDGRAADACVCARDTRKRGRTQAQPAASSPSARANLDSISLHVSSARRYVTAIHVASPRRVRARGRMHMFANICGSSCTRRRAIVWNEKDIAFKISLEMSDEIARPRRPFYSFIVFP